MFQLHGFCDASEVAYAIVVYLRMVDSDNAVHTSLVIAKNRVAPNKQLTVPRLELCGAVLLAKLFHHVTRILRFPLDGTFTWMDSLVVLDGYKEIYNPQDLCWE